MHMEVSTFEMCLVGVVIRVAGFTDVTWLKKLYVKGRDVTEGRVSISPGMRIQGATIVLSARKDEVVSVVAVSGRPVRNCEVSVFFGAIGTGLQVGPVQFDVAFKLHREEFAPGLLEGRTAWHISFGQAF